MDENDIKLSHFERMALGSAKAKRDEVLHELSLKKKKNLDGIKAEMKRAAELRLRRETAKISKEVNEREVSRQIEAKQQLIGERCRRIDALFDEVAQWLRGFVSTPEYERYLMDSITGAKDVLRDAGTVIISDSDRQFEEKIRNLGFDIEYSSEEIIGGCFVLDRANGARIDRTFAAKLRETKDSFLEKYNLKIEV